MSILSPQIRICGGPGWATTQVYPAIMKRIKSKIMSKIMSKTKMWSRRSHRRIFMRREAPRPRRAEPAMGPSR